MFQVTQNELLKWKTTEHSHAGCYTVQTIQVERVSKRKCKKRFTRAYKCMFQLNRQLANAHE